MKTVYQTDAAGYFLGETEADACPMQEGAYLIPAGCVQVAPPESWDSGKWPRWDGSGWRIVNRPNAATADPVAKLKDFLASNPDVAALIAGTA